jgi:hypothetical protein
MSESTKGTIRFETRAGMPLEAAFDAGRLTSDGGLPWLSEADEALGVCAALAACIPEWRQRIVRHSLTTLVRQRVNSNRTPDGMAPDAPWERRRSKGDAWRL